MSNGKIIKVNYLKCLRNQFIFYLFFISNLKIEFSLTVRRKTSCLRTFILFVRLELGETAFLIKKTKFFLMGAEKFESLKLISS